MKSKYLFFIILLSGLNSCTTSQKKEVVKSETKEITKETVEKQIINSLSEIEQKELFKLILNAQDKASEQAKKSIPDDNKWEERLDIQRELQSKYELEVYKKQVWWNKIDKNVDTANKIRNTISMMGVKAGWIN